MPVKPLKSVVALTIFALLAGCGGNGLGQLIGVWSSEDETLTVFKDGKMSVTGDYSSCAGTAKRDSHGYRMDFDCGVKKGIATAKLKDRQTLQVTIGDKTTMFRKRQS
ncbi:hypothetical protein GCM10029978_066400 [Actinoallomurus acanthiterrae]